MSDIRNNTMPVNKYECTKKLEYHQQGQPIVPLTLCVNTPHGYSIVNFCKESSARLAEYPSFDPSRPTLEMPWKKNETERIPAVPALCTLSFPNLLHSFPEPSLFSRKGPNLFGKRYLVAASLVMTRTAQTQKGNHGPRHIVLAMVKV